MDYTKLLGFALAPAGILVMAYFGLKFPGLYQSAQQLDLLEMGYSMYSWKVNGISEQIYDLVAPLVIGFGMFLAGIAPFIIQKRQRKLRRMQEEIDRRAEKITEKKQ